MDNAQGRAGSSLRMGEEVHQVNNYDHNSVTGAWAIWAMQAKGRFAGVIAPSAGLPTLRHGFHGQTGNVQNRLNG